MALTLGTNSSAFTPITPKTEIPTSNPISTSFNGLLNNSFSTTVLPQLTQPNYKSITDLSLEYAMYLLINQTIADRQALLSASLTKSPLFQTYSLPTNVLPPTSTTQNFLTVPSTRDSISPNSRHSSQDDLSYLQNSISKNKLGRSYNPGRPLAMADRQKILDLYEKGYKISHIARIIGVTHSCVSKIMTRYRRTGSMFPRSAQQNKKSSSSSISSSNSSKCSSSSNSIGSLSPNPTILPLTFDLEQNLLPKTTETLAISSSHFLPKPIPLTIQQC
uniref:Paired domain-containing protein n=1 Tax=Panagrolaimus sp. JU765 TaxID=591449 RepID=A0AC34QVX2_9BILA